MWEVVVRRQRGEERGGVRRRRRRGAAASVGRLAIGKPPTCRGDLKGRAMSKTRATKGSIVDFLLSYRGRAEASGRRRAAGAAALASPSPSCR